MVACCQSKKHVFLILTIFFSLFLISGQAYGQGANAECNRDDCGVCDGNNRDMGCDGVCFSGNTIDDCGVCGGSNKDRGCDGVCFSEKVIDECGVCGGENADKGCDGVCFSNTIIDDCGVCEGGNKDRGCDGECFSGRVIDECGLCGGTGPGPCGCDLTIDKDSCGICNGPGEGTCGCDLSVEQDSCGVCGGTGPGPCGCDLTIVQDSCGVCDGSGPGECGCDLSITKDSCGVCGGDGPGECGCNLDIVKDACGVCGGDGPGECGCNLDIVKDSCGVCGGNGPGACGCDSSIVEDACGVCGGDGPGECGCNLDIVKDSCGVCGGDGTSCCTYSVDVEIVSNAWAGEKVLTGRASQLSCFSNFSNSVIEDYQSLGFDSIVGLTQDQIRQISYDDHIARTIAGILGITTTRSIDTGFGFSIEYVEGSSSNLLLDNNCQAVERDPETVVCGDLHVQYAPTPVSFNWTNSSEENDTESLVKFPLNIDQGGKWYTWKASASRPLLVMDPERSGKIVSAKQLFGSWSFGGKSSVKVSASSVLTDKVQAWTDGYEALATLDIDIDGKLSGDELKGLSLWFDADKDAVSDDGEVKTLQELQVVAVYYNANEVDPLTGERSARVGYDRIKDGKLLTGSSIDWISEGTSTLSEAIIKQGMK